MIKEDKLKFITRKDYMEYLKKYSENELKEKNQNYILEKEEIQMHKEKLAKIDKKHDKMLKVILGRKREMIDFLNQFLKVKKSIDEDEIEIYATEFITCQYKNKYSDIIYKLEKEPIYFLIEHQSTVDNRMIERIGTYVQEIMRKEEKRGLYPIVVPIVIYTGEQRWKAKTNFLDKQYVSEEYDKYRINLCYNLITIQDYTFEELLRNKTLFSSFMMIEKCRNKQELITRVNQIIRIRNKDEKDQQMLSEIVEYIIAPYVGKGIANEMLKKINEKEEVAMSPLTKMFLDLEIKSERKGEERGEKKGELKGIKETIRKTAQKMLEKNIKIQDIEEITGLTREEIEKLEECM